MTGSVRADTNASFILYVPPEILTTLPPPTHRRAEALSVAASLDMMSNRTLEVSENFDLSTGAGTLRSKQRTGADETSVVTAGGFILQAQPLISQPFYNQVKEIRHGSLGFC